ncbi:chitinase [Catenulispora pinisilvae]|uniref:chitinase n=1 Tax=Catenulispora pinisilvae TaxID=2705253 RepID=UPI0018913296|nr:chitinase [Catenulispora pinisilvae]
MTPRRFLTAFATATALVAGLLGPAAPSASAASFVVSQAQFNQMFPSRNSFYTYQGLVAALGAYPAFTTTGDEKTRKREAAAFLANVSHETGGLKFVDEQNKANYSHYCDRSQPYGCPAGSSAYYGRGPVQISWNFNYKAAGDALHLDLLHNPFLVERDAAVAWKTGLWFWNSQAGAGSTTSHDAIVKGRGFGETIRSFNGDLECNGKNAGERNDRISLFKKFVAELGTDVGPGNLSC